MTMPPQPPQPPRPPFPPDHWWPRLTAEAIRLFHAYGNWLVGITWTKFILLSILLLVASLVLSDIAESGSGATSEEVTVTPAVPMPPALPAPVAPVAPVAPTGTSAKHLPTAPTGKSSDDDQEVTISINKNGVRISPSHSTKATAAASAPAGTAASAASASAASAPASSNGFSASVDDKGVEIKLPPGADSQAVRDAVEEARTAVVDAIKESQEAAAEQAKEAADEARESVEANKNAVRTIRRIRNERQKPPFAGLAWFFIFASAILKISYKGTVQAEVKAAVATETAESEQLKRQVVEARMAAMQAQVEPHFLFNTLASIDHLIETDPPRASQMQKNLIALLRASMPSMREANPAPRTTLGRELAVVRPYLEILKVRMEDRLQATHATCPKACSRPSSRPMMIQSLVENAIKHGLEPKAEGGTLEREGRDRRRQASSSPWPTPASASARPPPPAPAPAWPTSASACSFSTATEPRWSWPTILPAGTVVTLTVPYQAQPRAPRKASA